MCLKFQYFICLCLVLAASGLRSVLQPEEDADPTQADSQPQPPHGRVPALPQEVYKKWLPQSAHGKCPWRNWQLNMASVRWVDPKWCICTCTNSRLSTWPISTVRRNNCKAFTCYFSHFCWKYASRKKNQRHSPSVKQLENKKWKIQERQKNCILI